MDYHKLMLDFSLDYDKSSAIKLCKMNAYENTFYYSTTSLKQRTRFTISFNQ